MQRKEKRGARLRVLVGLGARLYALVLAGPTPKDMGIPSLIPPSSSTRLGSGKLDSGPAMPCRTSKLDLRDTFVGVEAYADGGGDDAIIGGSAGKSA